MSINKVTLLGNLTQDPEMKDASNGNLGCLLNLATNEVRTDKSGEKKEKTEFHRVMVWGKLAENCGLYLKKGERALIEGSIQTRQWEDKGVKKYITEIVASAVHFMGNSAKTEKDAMQTKQASQANSQREVSINSKPVTRYQPKEGVKFTPRPRSY